MKTKIIGILIILTLMSTAIISANENVDNEEIEYMDSIFVDSNYSLDNEYLVLADNLLPNPSFEEEMDNNPIGWNAISSSGATMNYVKTDSHTGEKCVSISNIGYYYLDDRWVTNDFIPVDFIDNDYIISSYYKYIGEEVENQLAGININFYDEDQIYISQFFTIFPYSEEWVYSRYSSQLFSNNVKQNTKFIRFDLIQVYNSNTGTPNNDLETMFDDVYFGIGFVNNPPSTPIINGPTNGKNGISYDYEIMSTDPDNDKIFYNIEFEEDNEYQTIFYVSGQTIIQNWTWNETGDYTIKVQSQDTFGAQSDWATLEVSMPKNKAINTPFLQFLENHPYLFPLLRQLLGV